uniref:Capsid triplex subunit 2 n=1 Tax=Infectious laryngotracheitis virus TaxID=10386 RepID=A0A7M3URH1_ILTV|nr:capsid triplex subunit 2 [Gallid alphaherpesvirus 1]
MTSGQYEIRVVLPNGLTRDEEDRLRSLRGTILMAPILRRCVFLHEIDQKSFFAHGKEPDYATLLTAYRRRFPILIVCVENRELSAIALSIGYPRGISVRNTGPFSLNNGDLVSLLPPITNTRFRVDLPSCGSVIEPAMTIPFEIGTELMGKIFAGMAYDFCVRNQIATTRPRDIYVVTYKNKTLDLSTLPPSDAAALQDTMKSLFSSVLFSIHEGVMSVLSLMPALLAGGANDPFLNAILQMQSMTRLSVQLFNPPALELPEPAGSSGRYHVFDAFAAWLSMSHRLGDLFNLKPVLKVVMFYSDDSTANEGDLLNAIVP